MPAELRAGPYYVVGTARAQWQQPERAALAFLRVPILYPENRRLAASALRLAATALEQLDRPDEAAALQRELQTRYGDDSAGGK